MKSTRVSLLISLASVILLLFVCSALLPDESYARVGGGQTYSGSDSSSSSSHSSSGSSKGDDGTSEILFWLVYLAIENPVIGVPLLIIFLVFIIFVRRGKRRSHTTNTYFSTKPAAKPYASTSVSSMVQTYQQIDTHFSLPLFLDFAQAIYTHALIFTGRRDLAKLGVYLHRDVIQQMEKEMEEVRASDVEQVILGSCKVLSISTNHTDKDVIKVRYTSNYTLLFEDNGTKGYTSNTNKNANKNYNENYKKKETFYVKEDWWFTRNKGVLSKGPEEIASIRCPNCGASLEDSNETKCSYCGVELVNGTMHWFVSNTQVIEETKQPPDLFLGYAKEVGTTAPTIFQDKIAERLGIFRSHNATFSEDQFNGRVTHIFLELQKAWSEQKWELARPFESDYLFQIHRYWIELYKKQKVFNRLEKINLQKIEVVRILQDLFFESITVRLHASMIDYLASSHGTVLAGNKNKPRPFTEYWTFIKKRGVSETDQKDSQCPNCGAPLSIGMTGICEYCSSKITTGDFNWILSQIEQDEEYSG